MHAMPDSMSTLVVGVGYVGRRLLQSLPYDTSLGFSRNLTGGMSNLRSLDLDSDDGLEIRLPDDYGVIYTVPPASNDAGDRYDDRRLQRLLSLLQPCPRRFVYLSTSGVYGDCLGAVVNETATIAPQTPRAKRRASAERLLADFCERNNIALVILRVPGIYGPGRLGVERVEDRQPNLDERDANPGNRIHVDDLARCCIAALRQDVPAGIYNVGDGDERSSTWFAEEVARQCDLESPPTVRRELAEKTFSPRRLSFLRESRRLDLAKMHELLVPNIQFSDAAEGIAASLSDGANT